MLTPVTFVLTKKGKKIDITPWLEDMKGNLASGVPPLSRSPIGIKCDGEYFWFEDVGEFEDLDKASVVALEAYIIRCSTPPA